MTVGDSSKTEAGEGRTIPPTWELVWRSLVEHSKWFLEKFGEGEPGPEWYLFPSSASLSPRTRGGHCTFVQDCLGSDAGATPASPGAGTIIDIRSSWTWQRAAKRRTKPSRDVAGHVSKQMLRHYSHIRMQAKRRAVGALVNKPSTGTENADSGQNQFQAGQQ